MAELGQDILEAVAKHEQPVSSLQLAEKLHQDHQKIIGAIKSLQGIPGLIEAEPESRTLWVLTPEGKEIATKGSHEYRVLQMVPAEGQKLDEIKKSFQYGQIGVNKALEQQWIEIDKKATGGPIIRAKKPASDIKDEVREIIQKLEAGDFLGVPDPVKADVKKRKLAQEQILKSLLVSKGPNFATSISKAETDLTVDMLAKNAWKEKRFKEYNFDALGVPPSAGYFHPLLKVRTEFRQIFLEMGFEEMPTNNFVENSFWNFDALFVPQQHPARDVQDTFFVSDPKETIRLPSQRYVDLVKQVHSQGAFNSAGYNYEWDDTETKRNILRTHTTAVSARMLRRLALKGFKPAKYFSIDRVFRNENLDATHLAEFHQIEGVVADYDLSLGHLKGVLSEFFKKLGITQLRFKPAYNPYTEPSMEIFSYHAGLAKWVEVGNSGVFRPEMLLPMGLPENVSVIAWGLSLERPTMIKYGIDNIRDLVGHKVDLQMVQSNPVCILDDRTEKMEDKKK
ncbi:phenylalanine--tRNA ligase alpha subunit-like [Paramacrobiotus metropolitanus]|uniref:phenylalanine--tRNA ligase alpha subunit-like n=1 Tax=Paramacrobiotus metropolitanus TaxID=2943436 RepID=UPI00244613B5|nr:phenylalanine--tRNA ligase alpha subunit-like [Paramacrobiotus metropolitanus]